VLTLAAPFPAVSAQTLERAEIAPGIEFARYHLASAAGPLVVTALALDLAEPTLSLGPVLASDRLVSSGETLSSMALRTGAVAALNADFFDVGNTYQPLGIVATSGTLLRSPSARTALTLTKAGAVRIGPVPFAGTVRVGERSWGLQGVGRLPGDNEIVLMQPAYGPLPGAPGVQLVPLGAVPGTPGTYRAGPAEDLALPHEPVFGLVLGAAVSSIGLPVAGDAVSLEIATDPPLEQIALSLGGGPQLLKDGSPYDDPQPPARDEANRLNPLSGALRTRDGRLVLVEVDGRAPLVSVGLRRPEFAALLAALGAIDGMGFDGGGSASLVARLPGDLAPQLQTVPSDGRERPISDALAVVSDAPRGPPARLAVQPLRLALMPGAHLRLHAVVTDEAGHALPDESTAPLSSTQLIAGPVTAAPPTATPLSADSPSASRTSAPPPSAEPPSAAPPSAMPPSATPPSATPPPAMPPSAMPPSATLPSAMPPSGGPPSAGPPSATPSSLVSLTADGTLTAGDQPGRGILRIARGAFTADIPFEVLAAPATLRIEPAFPNPEPGGRTVLRAVAADAAGFPIAVDGGVRWSATTGRIGPDGGYIAGRSDDTVTARIGTLEAGLAVPVGRHESRLDALARVGARGEPWRLSTVPANGPGALTNDAGALSLAYDFSGEERAVVASADLPLPGRPIEFSLDVRGDGSGAGLRVTFTNGDRERVGVTLVKRIDWAGWKRISLRLPPRATPPLALTAIAVTNPLGTPSASSSGSIAFRDLRIVLAGTSP
jgi:hypothetical protein